MADIIIHKLSEVYLQIECSETIRNRLYTRFGLMIPGVEHTTAFKERFTDGKRRFFNKKFSILPIGLIEELISFIKEGGYSYEQKYTEKLFKEESYESITVDDIQKYIGNPKIKLRDYQFESIKAALTKKRGILLNATAAGKSVIAYGLVREHLEAGRKILIVVPNTGLVSQLFKDFIEDYGWSSANDYVALFGGKNKKNYKKPVVISNFHSLVNEEDDFFEKFDVIIVDEAHRSTASTIEAIQKKTINAKYRLGMTGTIEPVPYIVFTIKQYLGPVIYTVNSRELQDGGYAAQLFVQIVRLKYPFEDRRKILGKGYDYERKFIMEHQSRNEALRKILSDVSSASNGLLLVHEMIHLNLVEKFVKSLGIKYRVIYGAIDVDDRDKIRQEIETSEGVLTIATLKSVGTGTNIKKLNYIINYGAWGKSYVDAGQVPGRGLRKIEGVKEECVLYDILDDLTIYGEKNYCLEHGEKRIEHYKGQKLKFYDEKIIELQ